MTKSADQVAAFVAGLDQHVEDCRARYAHDLTIEAHEAFNRAVRLAKQARVDAYGIPCADCGGHGYYNEVDRHSSDGLASFDCVPCGGSGRVLLEEATR